MHASLLPASSDSVVNLARAATFTLLAAAILARMLQFIVGSGSSKAGGGTASATADAQEGREGGSAAAASATADAGAARVGSHVYVDDSADPWPLGDIEAYLIDLDGTIYSPTGPIEGAAEFYAAVLRHKPHVFLSNTGAKGADGVRAKLSRNGIILGPGSQERHIWTATQAQCRFLADTLPPAARGFAGFADWSYDVIKKTSFLLSHGAHLIATAEDAFNPSTDNMPLPGPGMFCAMFRALLHPSGGDRIHVCGKGGGQGSEHTMWSGERARDRSRVLIVGDRFDTDVRAGSLAGVRTCLVESGCHQHALQPHFADAPAEFVAASVASLIPPHRRHDPSERPRTVAFDLCQPRVAIMARPGSISPVGTPPVTRQASDSTGGATEGASAAGLRAWRLGAGNMVYWHTGEGPADHGSAVPLILALRSFFEERAAPEDGLATVSARDALEAMRALGGNAVLRRIAGCSSEAGRAGRVTFAQLCRQVQGSLESDEQLFDPLPTPGGGSSPCMKPHARRRRPSMNSSSRPAATEAPAVLEAGARLRKWDTVALRQKQQRAAPRASSVTHNPLHGRGSAGSSARISGGGPLKRAGTMPPTEAAV
ncbi:hypothetical protein EMIHUDRAFT_217475 [Emiliania huxleyi CCMP1516]|uniref:Uncharacterized protein n=2 Tax=Emiliania huxleyi TaxID=2903 RepID=A0A0D3IAR4_EMIH1|nr:hypothetical protein EMIHUDRAFT_217475 [Emiliania huxleyi CCMP1516]EOD08349.1 hypothetical protein EMIHUDRAFT_217475 [Emiliania huxleyi CCMP1516]|eukprot:XP_005760778.1 hypothetical protein EMIHUDRAFT_217475 [Emiliania huxleyi CCMP1516]